MNSVNVGEIAFEDAKVVRIGAIERLVNSANSHNGLPISNNGSIVNVGLYPIEPKDDTLEERGMLMSLNCVLKDALGKGYSYVWLHAD